MAETREYQREQVEASAPLPDGVKGWPVNGRYRSGEDRGTPGGATPLAAVR